jgi:hypothetical protein
LLQPYDKLLNDKPPQTPAAGSQPVLPPIAPGRPANDAPTATGPTDGPAAETQTAPSPEPAEAPAETPTEVPANAPTVEAPQSN